MITRKLQSPGVEINEIDRSNYNKIDYSLPNSPTSLIFGFASRGEDSTFNWINSQATLNEIYGQPTTEFESYFYNAAMEILNRGGTCIGAKLPYMNNSYEKFNYVEYSLGDIVESYTLTSDIISDPHYNTIGDLQTNINLLLDYFNETYNTSNIAGMMNACIYLYDKYIDSNKPQTQTINDIKNIISSFIDEYSEESDYATLFFNDTNLTSYFEIKYEKSSKSDITELDDYITKNRSVHKNTIRFYDITRSQYGILNKTDKIIESELTSPNDKIYTNDFLGIIPVIVTPINAMFFQNILTHVKTQTDINYDIYNSISSLTTVQNAKIRNDELVNINNYAAIPLASNKLDEYDDYVYNNQSLSRAAALQFPQINYNGFSHFDDIYLKQIGVVVFKAFKDLDNNGKVNYQLVESFVGSLDKKAKDQITHANIFIDDIVNNNSKYIRMFSNADPHKIEKASTIVMSGQKASSLGFYQIDISKKIDYLNSIMKPLQSLLDNASNRNNMMLDLLIDAGVSNIAHLAKSNNGIIDTDEKPKFADYDSKLNGNASSVSGWSAILQKFDNFCKNQRKDCMFLADGLRQFCLDGDTKFVRKTSPQNTVANSIIVKLRYMTDVLNSSYSAGYCNWFYQQDYSKTYDYIWCPPSIKAAGVYVYCDVYAHPWSAPAGIARGQIPDAIDVAFNPLEADSGKIYSNDWNYAMSYPLDGIILEGHKTFQMQQTALDRVNVRRLLLWLEKQVESIARKFVYEGNTPYLRQTFVDTIKPIFEQAVASSGIKEYGIKCDDELNTPQVIENNELRCKIAVKPVKVVDWIVIDLISTRQSASISEELIK